MEITMRIGRWSHHLVLQFTDDTINYLADAQWDTLGMTAILVDNTLVVSPDGGHELRLASRENVANTEWTWEVDFCWRDPERQCLDQQQLPRFGLTKIQATLQDDGMLLFELPPIHEMEWPGGASKMSDEEWLTVMTERFFSQRDAGFDRYEVPDNIRANMLPIMCAAMKTVSQHAQEA